jgi:hypothetical protein
MGKTAFFECEASGEISAQGGDGSDSKLASSELELKAEIGLAGIIKAQVDFVKKSTKTNVAHGKFGHAAAQGKFGHAEVHGKNAIAAAFGIEGKVLGELGDWIVCAEWEYKHDEWSIRCVKSAKVDGEFIKPNTWYMLKNGKFVETEE